MDETCYLIFGCSCMIETTLELLNAGFVYLEITVEYNYFSLLKSGTSILFFFSKLKINFIHIYFIVHLGVNRILDIYFLAVVQAVRILYDVFSQEFQFLLLFFADPALPDVDKTVLYTSLGFHTKMNGNFWIVSINIGNWSSFPNCLPRRTFHHNSRVTWNTLQILSDILLRTYLLLTLMAVR